MRNVEWREASAYFFTGLVTGSVIMLGLSVGANKPVAPLAADISPCESMPCDKMYYDAWLERGGKTIHEDIRRGATPYVFRGRIREW